MRGKPPEGNKPKHDKTSTGVGEAVVRGLEQCSEKDDFKDFMKWAHEPTETKTVASEPEKKPATTPSSNKRWAVQLPRDTYLEDAEGRQRVNGMVPGKK